MKKIWSWLKACKKFLQGIWWTWTANIEAAKADAELINELKKLVNEYYPNITVSSTNKEFLKALEAEILEYFKHHKLVRIQVTRINTLAADRDNVIIQRDKLQSFKNRVVRDYPLLCEKCKKRINLDL